MAEAFVGERHEFPMVVAKMYQRDMEAMRLMGTSGLRQSDRRFYNTSSTNYSERTRLCRFCHEVKPLTDFSFDGSNRYKCNQCRQERVRLTNTDIVAWTRRCYVCTQIKSLDDFSRDATDGTAGRSYSCKSCHLEYMRRYNAAKRAA